MISEQRIIELAKEAGFSVTKENDIVVRCDYNDEWGVKDELTYFANALQAEWIKSLEHQSRLLAEGEYGNTYADGAMELYDIIRKLYALPNEEVK